MSKRAARLLLALTLFFAALAPRNTSEAQARVMPSLSSTNETVANLGTEASELTPESTQDALAADMANGRWTRGFVHHRIVHFTFDDGPRPSTTRRLLEQLDHYGIKATFFVVGEQLEGRRHAEQRALLREMARRGHTIGSHTFDHSNLTDLSDAEIEEQLTRTEAVFETTFGARPNLFRPPYGARDRRVDDLLARRGYTAMLWNLSSMDTRTRDPEVMLHSFRAQLDRQERHPRGQGGIILVHDTHEASVDAFPLMVEELRRRNCELLDQEGEELWDIASDPRIFYQARPGARGEQARSRFARDVRLDDETVAARQATVRAAALEYCR